MKNLLFVSCFLLSVSSLEAQILGSWNCLDFNGTTNYVTIPHHTSQNPGSSFTVEAWIKADSWASNVWQNTIVSKDTWSNVSEGWVIRCGAGGKLSFNLALNNNNSWYEVQTSALMSTDKWYHVAGTYDGSIMKVYLNGKQVGSFSQTGSITASSLPVKIGNIARPNDSRYFDGEIDEVRIWNAALSESTIRDYMCQFVNSNHPNYSKLISYYNINLGAGTSITDLSGNGQTGSIVGASWSVSGAALGDESVYIYPTSWTGKDLSLNHAAGDSMVVSGVSGSPQGLHLYRVDNHPNHQNIPQGIIMFHDFRYWGVFPTSGSNVSYDLTYSYIGYPSLGNKSKLNLSQRSSNSDSVWVGLITVNDTLQNTMLKTSADKGEFIMGISDELTAFSLVSPVNSTNINLQGSATQTVPFTWTSSTVGGLGMPFYNCLIDYDTADFSSPLLAYQSNNSGVDTVKTVSYQSLANLMNQLDLFYGQSLNAKWTAEAFTGPLAKKASSSHNISFTRGILSSDIMFSFRLNIPANNDTIKAVDGAADLELFNWSRANSTAGNDISYEVQFAGHAGDFNNPVGVFTSDNGGNDTLSSISHADLASMLKSLNLQSGQVFKFKWRTKAEIGSLQSYSADSQFVYMFWEESPFLGVKENKGQTLDIFPNPAHGNIVLHSSMLFEGPSEIILLDESGKQVKSWRIKIEAETVLSVKELSTGIYFLKITGNDHHSIQQVLIK